MRPEVRADIIVKLAPLHDVPVAKRVRTGTLLGDPKEAREKFGPFKVVLGTIPAVYANREVRPYLPPQNHPLTKTRCGKQG